jgi:O-glycosyl hydrolase
MLGAGCVKEPDPGTSRPEESSKKEPVSETVTEPVSGSGQEGSAQPARDESAVLVTVDPSVTHQTWEGFGSGFTWYSDWMVGNEHAEEAYDRMFSDLRLTNLRFRNTYQYGAKESAGFVTEKTIYEEASKRAKEYGEEVTVLLSSWSPAASLKSTGKIEGDSTILQNEDGTYKYAEFGAYMAEAVKAYREAGVPVDVLSLQNEPDYLAEDYDCCLLSYKEAPGKACYADAYLATYDALKKEFGAEAPHMIGPELFGIGNKTSFQLYVKPILEKEPDALWGICHHLYNGGDEANPQSFYQNMTNLKQAYPDTRKWMTEYYTETGLQMAQLIRMSLVDEEVSSYFYWDGVWNEDGGMLTFAWDRTVPFGVKEKYYAMKQFSRFILPGDVRVDSVTEGDRNVKSVSFLSEDGTHVTTVVINSGEEDRKIQLYSGKEPVGESSVMCSVFRDSYESEDLSGVLCQDAGSLSETQTCDLPAGSVITIVTELK